MITEVRVHKNLLLMLLLATVDIFSNDLNRDFRSQKDYEYKYVYFRVESNIKFLFGRDY